MAAPAAEPELFARLVRDHYSAALRYAGRLLRQDSEAEDCVQEAFAEAYRGLDTLRDPEAAAAWLRSIVRHRCARRLRRRDLTLVPFASDLDELTEAAEGGNQELSGFARRLLQLLPAHERQIVALFYLKECSQQEIASFLGLPLSTVNNRLHDARQRMKHWENHMEPRAHAASPADSDRVSRIGTLLSLNGPLVEARFDPGAPSDLFDAIAVVGSDGTPVECMKVARRLEDGRVRCLLTGGGQALSPGMTLLNTGKVGVGLTPLTRVPSVSPEDLLRAVDALRGPATAPPRILPSGIKAVDLLCPLAADGVAVQVGTTGVGRVVLLDELAARLGDGSRLDALCLVDRLEPDFYRGWDGTALQHHTGGLRCYWALSRQGTDPELSVLDAADAAIYLSPVLAVRGMFPAIDPQHSRSRLLRPEVAGPVHCDLARRVREELLFAKSVDTDPTLLELLACRAHAAASRRLQSFVPDLRGVDAVRLSRARKLQSFLTQPFEVAREVTRWPGVCVPLEQTLAGCRAILDGEVDNLPEGAFAYAGTLDDVREHARTGTSRLYGKG